MSKENDRIAVNIACLRTEDLPAALISTYGSHCDVWQTIQKLPRECADPRDVVIKRHYRSCRFVEARLFQREYRMLKQHLEEIVPLALFVYTRVDGEANMLVVAETVSSWFNIANPANEEEAANLLKCLPKARSQLRRFIEAARMWHEKEGRVIDLYGTDNLVLDKNREIKYLDSFGVFFHEDLLHILDEADEDLRSQITVSLNNLDYLTYLLSGVL